MLLFTLYIQINSVYPQHCIRITDLWCQATWHPTYYYAGKSVCNIEGESVNIYIAVQWCPKRSVFLWCWRSVGTVEQRFWCWWQRRGFQEGPWIVANWWWRNTFAVQFMFNSAPLFFSRAASIRAERIIYSLWCLYVCLYVNFFGHTSPPPPFGEARHNAGMHSLFATIHSLAWSSPFFGKWWLYL